MNLYYFYHDLPEPGTTFLATYADESVSKIFIRTTDGIFIDTTDNTEVPYDDWFTDVGYLYWEKINAK